MTRPNLIIAMLHLLGIVLFKFRPIPRVWGTWLMAVNLSCVFFLGHIEGQIAFAAALIATAAMAVIYQRIRFTRVLGICHILFVPMLVWLVARWDSIQADPALATWVALLIATNAVSLIVDATDVSRFFKGERAPHYAW